MIPESGETLQEALDKWRRWADEKVVKKKNCLKDTLFSSSKYYNFLLCMQVCCDYALQMAIPYQNPGVAEEMMELTGPETGVCK